MSDDDLTAEDIARYQRRAPRAGYWLGVLPTHPVIHGRHNQRQNNGANLQAQPNPAPPPYQPYVQPPPNNQQNDGANFQAQPNPAPAFHHAAQPNAPPPYQPYVQPPPNMYQPPAPGYVQPPAPGHQHYRAPPPPQYYAQAPYYQAIANPANVSYFSVSIPRNTAVVGSVISRTNLRLPTNLSFSDFWGRVCAQMDLDPLEASVGYKFNGDRVSDDPTQLANEADYRQAVTRAVEKTGRARTKEVVMVLINLKPPHRTAQETRRGRKRTRDETEEVNTSLSYGQELRELRKRLNCEKHSRCCYIDPITAEHRNVDVPQQTLWARSILLKEATLTRPPNSLAFDHRAKRARVSKTPSSSSTPVHVHVNVASGSATTSSSVHRRSPLADLPVSSGTNTDVIDLTEGDENVLLPSVGELLLDLHTLFPNHGYLQYESLIALNGITSISAIEALEPQALIDLGIRLDQAELIIRQAGILTRRARKGKNRAVVKAEVDEKEN